MDTPNERRHQKTHPDVADPPRPHTCPRVALAVDTQRGLVDFDLGDPAPPVGLLQLGRREQEAGDHKAVTTVGLDRPTDPRRSDGHRRAQPHPRCRGHTAEAPRSRPDHISAAPTIRAIAVIGLPSKRCN